MKPRLIKPGPGAGNAVSNSPAVSPGEAAQAQPGAQPDAAESPDWLGERKGEARPPPGVSVSSEAEQARNKGRTTESKRGAY